MVDHYLPGYRSGGPVKSISNLVTNLIKEFDFLIICSDRDKSDSMPYPNIKINVWNNINGIKLYYTSNGFFSFLNLIKILNNISYDLIYLNSFFSFKFSIFPFLINYFFLKNKKKCLIAPRGEFSPNAIKLKYYKKKIYLSFFNFLNFNKILYFQASSKFEKEDIVKELAVNNKNIFIAPDLILYDQKDLSFKIRDPGPLRLLFLSRISPMKNLDFLLKILKSINQFLEFSIYGPKEDKSYWNLCLNLIKQLPSNIKVNIRNEVPQNEVNDVFKKYDLLLMPTLGENFGHVIIEALSSGLPVLVSDKTPWRSQNNNGLYVLKLIEQNWIEMIKTWSNLDQNELLKRRSLAKEYFFNYRLKDQSKKKTLELFKFLVHLD